MRYFNRQRGGGRPSRGNAPWGHRTHPFTTRSKVRRPSPITPRWSPRGRSNRITTGRTGNMTFKKAILGVAMLAVMAGAANAGTNTIGLTGGLGVPTGNYGDAAGNGWAIGATGTHMVNSQWGFGGDLAYHAWGGSDNANAAAVVAFGPGSEFKWAAIQATAHALMSFPTQ